MIPRYIKCLETEERADDYYYFLIISIILVTDITVTTQHPF